MHVLTLTRKKLILLSLVIAFSTLTYQITVGKKGLIFYLQQKYVLNNNLVLIEKIKIEKLKTANKIKLLNDKSLDKDLIEEKAKNTLDLAEQDEIIVHKKKK